MGSLLKVNPAAKIVWDSAAPDGFASGWPILICLLGGFRVLKGGEPVSVRRGGKTQTLLERHGGGLQAVFAQIGAYGA